MDINYSKNQITLYGKVCKLDTLVKKLTSLSGEQVYHFLIDRTTQLPRKMNCMAMISVLNNKIKFLHSNSLSKDYFTKLQYYSSFSEQQLFMLFTKICDETDFQAYRSNLMSLILENYISLNMNDGELMYLKNLNKASMESFADYFNYITGACLEQANTFDGQDVEVLKANLQYSASNQDILDLAGKYGVPLPQRLKREEYLEYIFDYLKRKGTYTEAIVDELNAMNITQLSTYARRTGIQMQPNMSKTDMITYLFYFLEQCEIPSTEVNEIHHEDKYNPLDFRVDLGAVDSFGQGANKKVIFYAGDHEDEEEMNEILETEAPVYETITPEEKHEESQEAANPWKYIVKNFEEEKAQEEQKEKELSEQEAKIQEAKAMEDLLAEDIINETLAQIPEKKIEELDEPKIDIDVNKVEQNPEYGTGKIEKLAESKVKSILVWLSFAVSIAIMGACIAILLL